MGRGKKWEDDYPGYKIYVLTFPDGRKYVGATKRHVRLRWVSGKGYQVQKKMYDEILRVGWDNIEKQVIAYNLDKVGAHLCESGMIKDMRTNEEEFGFNLAVDGATRRGHKITDEHRRKISDALIQRHLSDPPKMTSIEKSIAQLERIVNDDYGVGVVQLNPVTGEVIKVWRDLNTACCVLELQKSAVVACCKGNREEAGFWAWRYTKDYFLEQ